MNFISREQTIAVVKQFDWSRGQSELVRLVESLFSFPAPNPKERYGRNVMGQTEDEFWAAVDRECQPKK